MTVSPQLPAAARSWRAGASTPRAFAGAGQRLGAPTVLLLVWLLFEFGRPAQAFKIPVIISFISFLLWIGRGNKQWASHSWAYLSLLAGMAVMVPLAANSYWAYMGTFAMTMLFLGVVWPLQSLLTDVRRVRLWSMVFLGISTYVALWAVFHQGYGPSGAGGAQDENYVAALIGMATPFAYFSLFMTKRTSIRLGLIGIFLIFCGAMVVQLDVSRGGFLGLATVFLYCLWRSPRRLLGFVTIGVVGAGAALLAGDAYWAEIGKTTDYTSGTGDMRLEIWAMGVRMWQANPLLGVGAGNFRWVLDDYSSAVQMLKFDRGLSGTIVAHSSHVEMLSETGLVGTLSFIVLLGGTWIGLGRVIRDSMRHRKGGPVVRSLAALGLYAEAVRASMLALLVNGVFLSIFYFSHMWLLFAVGTAIPFAYQRQQRALGMPTVPARRSRSSPRRSP